MYGADAVVHLAFAVMRGGRSDAELRDNNVNGTLAIFEAAARLGIPKIVNMSSVSVYGEGRELDESSHLNPSEKFTYAKHKAEIETIAAKRYPETIHLRSHLIFGRHAQPFLRQMSKAPMVITPRDPRPVLQVVHEQDVAQAIISALEIQTRGPFNLAAPEVVSLVDLVRFNRKMVLPVPLGVAKALAGAAKRMGANDELTWLEVLDTTLTVKCGRAEQVFSWTPKYSAWDARAEMT
jgi:nucleoside-diphosphate-sugar epimerase